MALFAPPGCSGTKVPGVPLTVQTFGSPEPSIAMFPIECAPVDGTPPGLRCNGTPPWKTWQAPTRPDPDSLNPYTTPLATAQPANAAGTDPALRLNAVSSA